VKENSTLDTCKTSQRVHPLCNFYNFTPFLSSFPSFFTSHFLSISFSFISILNNKRNEAAREVLSWWRLKGESNNRKSEKKVIIISNLHKTKRFKSLYKVGKCSKVVWMRWKNSKKCSGTKMGVDVSILSLWLWTMFAKITQYIQIPFA
jgi:hypothetical protein